MFLFVETHVKRALKLFLHKAYEISDLHMIFILPLKQRERYVTEKYIALVLERKSDLSVLTVHTRRKTHYMASPHGLAVYGSPMWDKDTLIHTFLFLLVKVPTMKFECMTEQWWYHLLTCALWTDEDFSCVSPHPRFPIPDLMTMCSIHHAIFICIIQTSVNTLTSFYFFAGSSEESVSF